MTLLSKVSNSERENADALFILYWFSCLTACRIFYLSLAFWNSTNTCLVCIHLSHFGEHPLDSFNPDMNVIRFWKICLYFVLDSHHFLSEVHGNFYFILINSIGNCIFIQPHSSWFDDLEPLVDMVGIVAKLTLTVLYPIRASVHSPCPVSSPLSVLLQLIWIL